MRQVRRSPTQQLFDLHGGRPNRVRIVGHFVGDRLQVLRSERRYPATEYPADGAVVPRHNVLCVEARQHFNRVIGRVKTSADSSTGGEYFTIRGFPKVKVSGHGVSFIALVPNDPQVDRLNLVLAWAVVSFLGVLLGARIPLGSVAISTAGGQH